MSINKPFITKKDLSETLHIPEWLSAFMLEGSTIFGGLRSRKIDKETFYYTKQAKYKLDEIMGVKNQTILACIKRLNAEYKE